MTSTSYAKYAYHTINIAFGTWLNKGDKIRLTIGTRLWCDHIRDGQELGWEWYFQF